jgi:hypothetical protein
MCDGSDTSLVTFEPGIVCLTRVVDKEMQQPEIVVETYLNNPLLPVLFMRHGNYYNFFCLWPCIKAQNKTSKLQTYDFDFDFDRMYNHHLFINKKTNKQNTQYMQHLRIIIY